jgi:DNA-binding NtrC family response regulator
MRRAWPGKVRELRNAIERACLLSESERIETSLLREDSGGDHAEAAAQENASTESPMPRLEEFLHLQDREFIRQALQRHDFQIGATADALGISRKSLWERMKRLAIG